MLRRLINCRIIIIIIIITVNYLRLFIPQILEIRKPYTGWRKKRGQYGPSYLIANIHDRIRENWWTSAKFYAEHSQ